MTGHRTNLDHFLAWDFGRYLQVYRTMVEDEFPWEAKLTLTLALIRPPATTSIAAQLGQTGDLTEQALTRIVQTSLSISELVRYGFDHDRGRDAVRQITATWCDVPHSAQIYVLASATLVPLRWMERYGWRRPTAREREATYQFHARLAEAMAIPYFPDCLGDLADAFDNYEMDHLRPSTHAATVEHATRRLIRAVIGRPLTPILNILAGTIHDPPMRAAAHLPRPTWPIRAGLHAALRAHASWRRLARPRTQTAATSASTSSSSTPNT